MCSLFHEKAFAKINFGLKVLPKRPDGFHELESIFQTINVYDELVVEIRNDSLCIVTCKDMDLPENNTITAAYKAFCELAICEVPGINVELIKGIPSGGGLGGGSSDAAALVRVLERICNVKLNESQLDYIAGKTGSDVFFFVHCDSDGSGCAVVTGRGEFVRKINPRKDLNLVLIFPDYHSSTKLAYELVDKQLQGNQDADFPLLTDLEKMYNSPVRDWKFKNSFTEVLRKESSLIEKALDELNKSCSFSDMSGSGSTVYGIFDTWQQAVRAKERLASSWRCEVLLTR